MRLSSIAIAGSTLLNNQALGGAGGESFAAGSALESSEAILFTVSNSTFVGNQAVGGNGTTTCDLLRDRRSSGVGRGDRES